MQSSKGNITLLYNKVLLCYYFFVMSISIYYTIMMVILLSKLRKVFYEKLYCLFTSRKTNTSKLSHSKNCNKFSMRKCVVCSHWEKQTLQGFLILKIVINLVWENVCSHVFPFSKLLLNLDEKVYCRLYISFKVDKWKKEAQYWKSVLYAGLSEVASGNQPFTTNWW